MSQALDTGLSHAAARSSRQQILGLPGIQLMTTRREREGTFVQTIDLLRCAAPGLRTCFIKVAWWRGQLAEYEVHFTRGEALALWEFRTNTADLAGLAIPEPLTEMERTKRKIEAVRWAAPTERRA